MRLQLKCAPPETVQLGRPSQKRLSQRSLEQQPLAGNAGLDMVADGAAAAAAVYPSAHALSVDPRAHGAEQRALGGMQVPNPHLLLVRPGMP